MQVLKCSKRRRFVVATICPSAAAAAAAVLCCCCVHGGSSSLLPQLLQRVIADRNFVDNFRAIESCAIECLEFYRLGSQRLHCAVVTTPCLFSFPVSFTYWSRRWSWDGQNVLVSRHSAITQEEMKWDVGCNLEKKNCEWIFSSGVSEWVSEWVSGVCFVRQDWVTVLFCRVVVGGGVRGVFNFVLRRLE